MSTKVKQHSHIPETNNLLTLGLDEDMYTQCFCLVTFIYILGKPYDRLLPYYVKIN